MKLLYIFILSFNSFITYSQVRVIDLVFSNSTCGNYASTVANSIEQNEINKIYNVLSFDFDYESISFEDVHSSIIKYYRPSKDASPGYLNCNSTESDTCYFERHYFIEQNGSIKWLAQLIITSIVSNSDNPIYKIEYLDNQTFLDRSTEIKTAFNGDWMKKELSFDRTPYANRIFQAVDVSKSINRNIETAYVNDSLNFGFDLDLKKWMIDKKTSKDSLLLFEGRLLDVFQEIFNESERIKIGVVKLDHPVFQTEKQFEDKIKGQLKVFKSIDFLDVHYDLDNSFLEFASVKKDGLISKLYNQYLFFLLNFKESIYFNISSNDKNKLDEITKQIKDTYILK